MDRLGLKGKFFEFLCVFLDHEHTACTQLLDLGQGLQRVLDVEDWRRSKPDDMRAMSGVFHL
jgi:hypothetical protein